MTAWTKDEISGIGESEEVDVAALTRDGSVRNRVTIWVVGHGEDLYVRSIRGRSGAWFRAVHGPTDGRIWAGRFQRDVKFEEADPGIIYRQARRVVLDPASPLHVQADGEDAGFTPCAFEAVPDALDVVVLSDTPPGFLGEPDDAHDPAQQSVRALLARLLVEGRRSEGLKVRKSRA